jgi:integrase
LAIRCVAAKEKAGKAEYYCKCLRRSLQLFMRGREDTLAHSIQPHHIEAWVHSDPAWSQFTKSTYLRDVRTMFSYGVKNQLTTMNPAAKVERPSMLDVSPAILKWQECERFMRAVESTEPKLVQLMALCLFAGLRPSEAFRIQPENIKLDHIEVFGKKVRARNRRLVTINPTLRQWLFRYPGEFSPKNLQRRMRKVRATLGEFRWPQDWMRHTFVSNFFALHGAKATALEAGHSETVLFQHYRELVTREDAERFWRILPKNIP